MAPDVAVALAKRYPDEFDGLYQAELKKRGHKPPKAKATTNRAGESLGQEVVRPRADRRPFRDAMGGTDMTLLIEPNRSGANSIRVIGGSG